jgi:hypothetical protein
MLVVKEVEDGAQMRIQGIEFGRDDVLVEGLPVLFELSSLPFRRGIEWCASICDCTGDNLLDAHLAVYPRTW